MEKQMTQTFNDTGRIAQERWLKLYYAVRATFSVAWVVAALTVGKQSPGVAAVLLVVYPFWDALANYLDAARSGGLARNRTQAINTAVSVAAGLAVAVSLANMNAVLGVFGAWAILSGLLQLGTAVRRWKTHGAQSAMVLSGAQSALAGSFFIVQALKPEVPSIANVAGYAGVGAFYFLVSALLLVLRKPKAA
jgi:uncharacterized membrane protein HdeD (DUF308 family)